MKSDPAYTGIRIRTIRRVIQLWFVLLSVWMGYGLYRFVTHFEQPGMPFVERPSGVDAFLPISALMSLKVWLVSGAFDPLHPAALVIFLAALAVSLVMRKGFCGWICPIGALSEWAWMGGKRLMGRNLRLGESWDMALRAIKYLLMGIFMFFIWLVMSATILVMFFMSDYYKIADVRMLKFFSELSLTAMLIILALVTLSVLYKNFWCRYLCPYGALLGLAGLLSPFRITRDKDKCIGCKACTRACPMLIEVHGEAEVNSPECIGCLSCVSRCPEQGAISMTFKVRNYVRSGRWLNLIYPLLVVVFFYLIISFGALTDHWQSKIPLEEYQRILTPADRK